MKIGVIGNGVVGHATARTYMEHAEVRVFDVVLEKRTHSGDQVLECDIIFVCIPESGVEQQLSYFETDEHRHKNFVIKSTVPIGTTRRLAEKYKLRNLVHSPEFLTARCAVTDAMTPARNVIGLTGSGYNAPELRALYGKRFPGIQTLVMSSDESEAVKLFQNGFFAVKVAYFNEINALAQKLGLDWETVRDAMLADGRIAHAHTQVPGPDGKYGFGGSCLPKDLQQLRSIYLDAAAQVGEGANMTPDVINGALRRNLFDRERT